MHTSGLVMHVLWALNAWLTIAEWCYILLMCALQIKTALIKTGMFEDSMPCHLASGLGAGFFAVICGSPVDVVKSRLMGMQPLLQMALRSATIPYTVCLASCTSILHPGRKSVPFKRKWSQHAEASNGKAHLCCGLPRL